MGFVNHNNTIVHTISLDQCMCTCMKLMVKTRVSISRKGFSFDLSVCYLFVCL